MFAILKSEELFGSIIAFGGLVLAYLLVVNPALDYFHTNATNYPRRSRPADAAVHESSASIKRSNSAKSLWISALNER